MKSTVASRFSRSTDDLHLDHLAGVGRVFVGGCVGQPLDHAAHALGRVVLHVAHIGLDHVEPEMRDHLAELGDALLVGGDLRLQVGDVLRRVARGVGVVGQQRVEFLFHEGSAIDDAEIVDQHAFLVDGRGERRHRSRRRAADIGMVTARRRVEEDFLAGVVEDRRHHGDVRQMRAAIIGCIQREHVARMDVSLVQADHRLDRAVHGAQMHRHMRGVGDQRAGAVEDRAGEVEPLLDVHGRGRVLQRHAHLLGDRHEEVVEHFEHHRVGFGAECGLPLLLLDARQEHVVLGGDLRAPAGLDHDRLVAFDDQRRP